MELLLKAVQNLENDGYKVAALVQSPGETTSSQLVCSKTLDTRVETTLTKVLETQQHQQHPQHQQHQQHQQPAGPPKKDVTAHHDLRLCDLDLNNPYAVENYLKNVFSMLRQLHCKAIAKAWIKVVEPRKKARHPYIKGELFRPYWWPTSVEHREPDHLRKPQRIMLMIAILTQLVPQCNDPNLLHQLKKSTMSIHFPKNSGHHQIALDYVYKICGALCMGLPTIAAFDCTTVPTGKMTSKSRKKVMKMDPALEHLTLLGTLSPDSLDGAESRPVSGPFPSMCHSSSEYKSNVYHTGAQKQQNALYSSNATHTRVSSTITQPFLSSISGEGANSNHFSDLGSAFVNFGGPDPVFDY
ncbi:LAME_0G08328g1_1 [Lachancea meyersii CBS 8951]|uniref:LAME_0G08328g1_1 n=1 Tax=Lachancea meyersii CBS 8951 TaxID=1266667 RepID=A0A1G4K8C4_9SACH|nr:LAME_0G08328g1_1 [Lachancea meyersii CBS 8951]